jgi:hypothetical protein
MPDMQRAGRVGGYELHLHLLAGAGVRTAVSVGFGQDACHDRLLDRGAEKEIDEPGARHFCALDHAGRRQFAHDAFRDDARILLQCLGQLKCHVAGEVAVQRLLRPVENDFGCCDVRRHAGQRGVQQTGEFSAQFGGHG